MKKTIILLTIVTLCSCEKGSSVKESSVTASRRELDVKFNSSADIELVEIDGCEYIYVPNGNASWGAHKGNCKYCEARKCKIKLD